jgi:hypothetical protein
MLILEVLSTVHCSLLSASCCAFMNVDQRAVALWLQALACWCRQPGTGIFMHSSDGMGHRPPSDQDSRDPYVLIQGKTTVLVMCHGGRCLPGPSFGVLSMQFTAWSGVIICSACAMTTVLLKGQLGCFE